jgi:bacterioferritin-associated ferredoxin
MYICVCNALREAEVRPILENLIEEPADVHRALGCAPRCGRCLPKIERMRQERLQMAALAAE